ncbi:unnamed protein product [Microthlaspi erraticum]|uniref:F-box domain-containing protein n=1 Tax=Microthlaspi erraticum TaxID=1685480 RepID=A0A6D2IWV9_9BRAS|nr:unnamed protein product [Microthlaspi erraticum]CAA7031706.1 unnamed protein product [Microthlaspi erraticum]
MSSPEKKRKKNTARTKNPSLKRSPLLPPTPQSTPNPTLPDDVLLSCFARVSRLHYPSLSLVSKSFRSLLSSLELYQTRSHLHRTERCLYVCLSLPPDPNPRWFTLCRRPNRNLTKKRKKKQSSNLLVPITSPHSTPVRPSFVVIGSEIYEIGGLVNGAASSTVSVFDCRSHSWRKAPNMLVAREQPYAKVIDGKIYVRGLEDLVEVFDPKTQTWNYESTEWKSLDDYYGIVSDRFFGMASRTSSSCVIDSVLYSYYKGEFKWYDKKVTDWRTLKGLWYSLPAFFSCSTTSSQIQLADYGGKMAVLWDRHDRSSNCKGRKVLCAVVTLERRTSEEIRGRVEWSDDSEAVLKVPGSVAFVGVVAATL